MRRRTAARPNNSIIKAYRIDLVMCTAPSRFLKAYV